MPHLTTINKITITGLICLTLSACSSVTNRGYNSTPLRSQVNNPSAIYPTERFDANNAKAALGLGKSTIKGRFCIPGENNTYYFEKGVTVSLYPVTPYFESWYRLKQSSGTKSIVNMAPEAIKYRIDTITDDNGKFQFTKMLPGKYFIQGYYGFRTSGTYSVYRGTTQYSNSLVDNYEDVAFTKQFGGLYDDFVEIKQDGEVQKISLYQRRGISLGFDCQP